MGGQSNSVAPRFDREDVMWAARRSLLEFSGSVLNILAAVVLALLVAGLIFQRPLGIALDWLLDRRLFRFFLGPKEDEKNSE